MKVPSRARRSVARLAALCAALLLVGACSEPPVPAGPIEMTADTACSLDGMLLQDFPGPKGQIQYEQGPPDFFCDTREMFATYLQPEERKRVIGVFTQDMGSTEWDKPRGHWIDAKSAFFVAGSRMKGSMGPTLAAFARVEDAKAFAGKHGGRVLRFDEVTADAVALDGGAAHDQRM